MPRGMISIGQQAEAAGITIELVNLAIMQGAIGGDAWLTFTVETEAGALVDLDIFPKDFVIQDEQGRRYAVKKGASQVLESKMWCRWAVARPAPEAQHLSVRIERMMRMARPSPGDRPRPEAIPGPWEFGFDL